MTTLRQRSVRSPVTEFSPYMMADAASMPPPVAGEVMFAAEWEPADAEVEE